MIKNNVEKLPKPDDVLLQHSKALSDKIRDKIKSSGPISFETFMRMALYEPGLGYYCAGLRKFGEQGDFVTAPEISSLFSRCLARQCAEVLGALGGGDILELGAGSGVMAADILLELKKMKMLPAKYFILEPSPDLQERQQVHLKRVLPDFFDQVVWLSSLPKEKISGVVLANEVLDAMPVRIFRQHLSSFKELFVDWDNRFVFFEKEPDAEFSSEIKKINICSDKKYESEINYVLPAWIASLSDILRAGIILLIDYGFPQSEYYHPDRYMGTLMCHYRHRAHDDPFLLVGLQDITAHVDFTAIARAAVAADLTVSGYTNQANFLIGCGLSDFIEDESLSMDARYVLAQQIKKLILPSEMGELFKVIALSRDLEAPMLGFSQRDLRDRL